MTTPTPAPASGTDTAAAATIHVDQVLAERCQSGGDYLAGLIAHGHLDTAGTPRKLPEALFPNADPGVVRAVWDAALAVGYRAGQLSLRPAWAAAELHRTQDTLNAAGYATMARLAARSGTLHPPRHPADDDTPTIPAARGGHW
ncbi:hypothetical protein E6R18_24900 [Streptomyces sp. A1277]|uniref:hypothetical protein n=1 Tax=Streptomyces sp. A1277 TaxID=2563103 RepID=UPI0010A2782B|nr:hypothetical protein [Streptomyces sp. A1277]THA29153.1 hypothetical protein E6R18_24900 [Streptomyces sp. A1277]